MSEAKERAHEVAFKGQPYPVVGPLLKPGDKAPNFKLLDQDLKEKTLKDYAGKVVLLSVVYSLETSICDIQTRRFNQDISGLGSEVAVVTISNDMPVTHKRWCTDHNQQPCLTLADNRDHNFGKRYGTWVKDLGLHQRSVFVLDKKGIIRYVQYMPSIGDHPDYEKPVAVIKELLKEAGKAKSAKKK
jgi:thioredoxin-dependent peroxiredoxin